MIKLLGKKVDSKELEGLFEAPEGDIELIYGRIGEGKTTEAVRRMLLTLSNGGVVYSNVKMDLSNSVFDDRQSLSLSFWNWLLFRKRYFSFRKENYHYFDPNDYEPDDMVEYLSKLTDCEIYYDEGHWLLDSYQGTKISKARRRLVLETRHFNRKLVLITQRPTAIAVSARGNVNRFWKCRKLMTWPFLMLRVEEFQDMAGETVDDTQKPVSQHIYIANNKYFSVFNTFYLRGGVLRSQDVFFDAFDLSLFERFNTLLVNFLAIFSFLRKKKLPKVVKEYKIELKEPSKLPF